MHKKAVIVAAALAAFGGLSPAVASDATTRDTAQCIRITDIVDAPVVDPSTILLKLRAGRYKRLDLTSPCYAMVFDGFAYATSLDTLCDVDQLHDRHGETCIIKDIVDITPAEAQALLKHHPR